MDLYTQTSRELSRLMTLRYSTSFGLSTFLLSRKMRTHIYAIYGLVRLADEIVDTYTGADAGTLLDNLEKETYDAMDRGYSTNPIIHAFVATGTQYTFERSLVSAFFVSMRMDLTPQDYTKKLYTTYIYGSAEVIGLLCLAVFVEGDRKKYAQLKKGAQALGAAYQKVNFLRDLASDHDDLGRIYFPGYTYETFDEDAKKNIIDDISNDFATAQQSLDALPKQARRAVDLSAVYYRTLLKKLTKVPVETIKSQRIRVSDVYKIMLFIGVYIGVKR